MGVRTGPREERTSPFTRILVPIDGSDASIQAMRTAANMAAVHRLPVIALYVIADKTVDEMMAVTGDSEDAVRRQLEEKGWSYLEHAERIARSYGVTCERMVRRGIPHSQVADVVEDQGADLVVLGEARRQISRRALLGSFTEHVIEYVPCSVLVVKSD